MTDFIPKLETDCSAHHAHWPRPPRKGPAERHSIAAFESSWSGRMDVNGILSSSTRVGQGNQVGDASRQINPHH